MATDHGAVSVVVATRNRVGELLPSLARLRALPEQPAVIVVDNGSTDGTVAAVRRSFPDIDVIALPANRGAAARNAGVRRATTPLVAFCDDDSSWEPGALELVAGIFQRQPLLALVAAAVLVGDKEEADPTSQAMASSPLPGDLSDADANFAGVLGFLACASIVRRSAFLAVGGFDPDLWIGGEEELLAIDLAGCGWKLIYAPQAVAHHYPSTSRNAVQRSRVELRNALWVAWARRPPAAALRRSLRLLAGAVCQPRSLGGAIEAARGWRWPVERRRLPSPIVEARLRALESGKVTARTHSS